MLHPWHEVSYGKNAPDEINAIIEISKDSKIKYELDKESGMLVLDRMLYSAVHYPASYGFIPQSYCDDKDPLDVLVICEEPILPMTLVKVIPIGVMKMIDGGEGDDKIIAVLADDPEYKHVRDIKDLSPHLVKKIEQFFKEYKNLENKTVEVNGFFDATVAKQIVKESIDLYNTHKEELRSK